MNYFIIRSETVLTDTVNRFISHGYHAKGVSVTKICYLSPIISEIHANHAFIFTSIHAVQGINFSLKPTHSLAFCVGDLTAKQAFKAGFTNIIVPKIHNSQGLFELIKQYHSKEFIYCTGKHRKSFLEDNLKKNNLNFLILETYEAQECDGLPDDITNSIMQNQDITFICLSNRNAEIFFQLLQKFTSNQHIKQFQWHVVSSQNKIYKSYCNIQYHKTPQDLYNFFNI